MLRLRLFGCIQLPTSLVLVVVMVVQLFGPVAIQTALWWPSVAEAALVTIDTTASTDANTYNVTGSQSVFVNDQTGYLFYRDSNGSCVYTKTTNGGDTWGGAVTVDAQLDCIKIVVWYDRWTPGNTGDAIHIITLDTGEDDLFYNRLDTTTDTLLNGTAPTNASINSGQVALVTSGANTMAVTLSTTGEVFASLNDNDDSFVVSCSANCDVTTNWNEVGTSPFDAAQIDPSILAPVAGGGIMLINRDVSANDIRWRLWNGASWTGWGIIDANTPENTANFDGGMSLSVDYDTGDIYLVYASDNDNFTAADHDIRTAVFNGSSWNNTADVFTNVAGRGLHNVSVGYDQNTGDVYVGYIMRDIIATATTGNVYWRVSTTSMATWGPEEGPLNAVSGNLYGINLTSQSYERIYAHWFDPAPDDIFGDTVANIGPDTIVSATGTQQSAVRAGSTGVYIGGTFVVETVTAKNVTALTLTERGTINGETGINNVSIAYDLDTSFPYDCASESYDGGETSFGITDTNGFSGADGVSSFSGSIVPISSTQSMCVYVILDVLTAAGDGQTIDITIDNPATDVVVSGSVEAFPASVVALPGSTVVTSADLTLGHYHWRNDNGTEAAATSATGGIEDTPIGALQKFSPKRLRLGISNEGSTTTLPTVFRLEYGVAAPTCDAVGTWTDVGLGGAFELYDSGFITDGTNTVDIPVLNGGVSNEASTFVTPNGGLRDVTSTTSPLVLDTDEFTELEFAVVATSTAVEGETYCFRVTDNGSSITTYSVFPRATIDADVRVRGFGSATSQIDIPTTASYFGGGFSISENVGSRNVTSITITESGTVDAMVGLNAVRLQYDLDTTLPYDCASESYDATEPLFGVTDTDGMSAANGTSTFTGSVTISTTSTMCVYVVADVTTQAQNNETVSFRILSAGSDVLVSGGGSVAPTTPVGVASSTQLRGGILTQTHYHWRNDDGTEALATSATGGSEDTPLLDLSQDTPLRLRVGISNEGATTSVPTRFRLEYGPKITTCDAVGVWTPVDNVGDGWSTFDSIFLTHGSDTTDVGIGLGGITNENVDFKTPNAGVRDTDALTASTTLSDTEFIELEYSLVPTSDVGFNTSYCFRVSNNSIPLPAYTSYAEVTTAPKRDFKVQRGSLFVSGTSTTIVAGTHYTAPVATSSAFIRITNSHYTGAGRSTLGGTQNADDTSIYIENPANLLSSITFARPPAAINNTYIDWEIIEFIGDPGTDNEIIVRDVGTVNYSNVALIATGTAVSVSDPSDVVVYVTGVQNRNTSRNYYAGQVTSAWSTAFNQPVFRRGATGSSIVNVSYAVVEYTGLNWRVQRAEHSYTAAGVVETESISPVNSLSRAFIHAQKRMGSGSTNVLHYGHTVWLSSIGAVSFLLEPGASVAFEQTSVAWVVENLQGGAGAMNVQRRNGLTIGGAEAYFLPVAFTTPVAALNNTSVTMTTSAQGTNTAYPRPIAGIVATSTTEFQIMRSDTGTQLTYQVEVIEWPVADLAFRQNYYRIYADNNLLTPNDPWPPGPSDLGENTSITTTDEPLGEGDVVRIRLSLKTANANTPPGLEAFTLQYGFRTTTCTAVTVWSDVGVATSSAIWRGFNATGTTDGQVLSVDPPTPGDVLLSVSDVAGRLTHNNPTQANPYAILEGDDVEYDWYLQQNGAVPSSVYCFRVVRAGGEPLSAYIHYPQIRTAGFSPVTMNWRWYGDPDIPTPVSPLAFENSAPINIASGDALALRLTVDERKNVPGIGARFALQFSDDTSFANPVTVVATTSCVENSLWCFYDGGGVDNTLISTSTLSDGDGCTASTGDGCGSYHESSEYLSGHTHGAGRAQEYSFTITQQGARVNAVYYFRLYDLLNNDVVPLDTAATYPSVVVEGSSLTLGISGVPADTLVSGVITDATTTPTAIDFGNLTFNTEYAAAQQLTVTTNATEGYQVLKYARQQFNNAYGEPIPSITGTNVAPVAWLTGCSLSLTGCVGYHTTDATLRSGSARFAPLDSFAGLHTDPAEIMYSSIPVTNDTHEILYRLTVSELQPAGQYETSIVYIALPVF